MTQEEKQLLLKDLLPRQLYGVKAHYQYYDFVGSSERLIQEGDEVIKSINLSLGNPIYIDNHHVELENIKPYLRPMSSMTEEERDDFEDWSHGWFYVNEDGEIFPMGRFTDSGEFEYGILAGIEYLIKNHFDYHGLIHMGLALEAPVDMYK